jgi:hypothetical protein
MTRIHHRPDAPMGEHDQLLQASTLDTRRLDARTSSAESAECNGCIVAVSCQFDIWISARLLASRGMRSISIYPGSVWICRSFHQSRRRPDAEQRRGWRKEIFRKQKWDRKESARGVSARSGGVRPCFIYIATTISADDDVNGK